MRRDQEEREPSGSRDGVDSSLENDSFVRLQWICSLCDNWIRVDRYVCK